jgi:hypothetical protein
MSNLFAVRPPAGADCQQGRRRHFSAAARLDERCSCAVTLAELNRLPLGRRRSGRDQPAAGRLAGPIWAATYLARRSISVGTLHERRTAQSAASKSQAGRWSLLLLLLPLAPATVLMFSFLCCS